MRQSDVVRPRWQRALGYQKTRKRISTEEAEAFVALLRNSTPLAVDPTEPSPCSADPGDDYLFALAEQERAILVSGDRHVLVLTDELPITRARAFLDTLPVS